MATVQAVVQRQMSWEDIAGAKSWRITASVRAQDLPGPVAKIPQILPKTPPDVWVKSAFSKGKVTRNCMFLVCWVLICVLPAGPRAGGLFTENWSLLFRVTGSHSNRTDSDKSLDPKIVTIEPLASEDKSTGTECSMSEKWRTLQASALQCYKVITRASCYPLHIFYTFSSSLSVPASS